MSPPKVEVWPGADADFALFQDDGETYNYEKSSNSDRFYHWGALLGYIEYLEASRAEKHPLGGD